MNQPWIYRKIWNASRICVSYLCRGHANLLCIVPILVYVLPKRAPCPTLCDPMDYSPPGSSVLGTLQARILERIAISFSRGSFQPRDWIQVSSIAGRFHTIWATREASNTLYMYVSIYKEVSHKVLPAPKEMGLRSVWIPGDRVGPSWSLSTDFPLLDTWLRCSSPRWRCPPGLPSFGHSVYEAP